MRLIFVSFFVILAFAGCGSKGPAVLPQTRPAADAARLGLARDCVHLAQEAIGKAPDNFLRDIAIDELIWAEARLGDIAAARKLAYARPDYTRVGNLRAIGREQGLNGDLAGARETFKAAQAMMDKQNHSDLCELAVAEAEIGDLVEARRNGAKLTEDWRAEVLIAIAECEAKAGYTADAKDDLATVRKIQRGSADGMPKLAVAWYRVGDVATAVACIDEMPQPFDRTDAWIQLARAEYEAGDTGAALASVKHAQALLPGPGSNVNRHFRLRAQIGTLLGQCGEASESKVVLANARDDVAKLFVDKKNNAQQVLGYSEIAASQRTAGDSAGAEETLTLGLARIPELPDDQTRALGMWVLADGTASGNLLRALSLLDQAAQYAIPDADQVDLYLSLSIHIQDVAAKVAENDPPDVTWIERVPSAAARANAYAVTAFVLGEAPKKVAAGTSKP